MLYSKTNIDMRGKVDFIIILCRIWSDLCCFILHSWILNITKHYLLLDSLNGWIHSYLSLLTHLARQINNIILISVHILAYAIGNLEKIIIYKMKHPFFERYRIRNVIFINYLDSMALGLRSSCLVN